MKTIPVFIDTSALPRHLDRPGGPFEVLAQLVSNGIVEVFTSKICEREWSSQIAEEVKRHLTDSSRAISAAARGPMALPPQLANAFNDAGAAIGIAEKDIEKAAEAGTARLLQTVKAAVLPVASDHGASVMEAYFAGTSPFGGRKERNDIPDAFILEALKDLKKLVGRPIFAVIKDKRLAEAAHSLKDIRVFPDLKQLLQSEPVVEAQKATEREASWEAWLELFEARLPNATRLVVQELQREIEKQLAYAEIESHVIPSENSTAVISGTDVVKDLELNWNNVERLGAGWLSVPFQGTCSVMADFDVYRADAYSLPDWVSVQFGDPEEDKYFEAEATFIVNVSGTASVHFNEDDVLTGELSDPTNIELDQLDIHVVGHE